VQSRLYVLGASISPFDPEQTSNAYLEGLAMARTLICCDLDRRDAAIDDVVADCTADMVSAVKALLLINEQLESELQQLYAVAAYRSLTKRHAKIVVH
jgi:hypothetical protein